MREIKFRAWNTDDLRFAPNFNVVIPTERDGITHRFEPADNVILCQYTGLKDKNGKEIYEGDIVNMPYSGYTQKWVVRELCAYGLHFQRLTNKPYSAPHHYRDLKHKDELKVIGNIYENKELLEAL